MMNFQKILWDIAEPQRSLLAQQLASNPQKGFEDNPNLWIKALASFTWYELIDALGTTVFLDLLDEKNLSKLFPKGFQNHYRIGRELLRKYAAGREAPALGFRHWELGAACGEPSTIGCVHREKNYTPVSKKITQYPTPSLQHLFWDFPIEQRERLKQEWERDPWALIQTLPQLRVRVLQSYSWYDLLSLFEAEKLEELLSDETIAKLFPRQQREFYTRARRLLQKYR